MFCLVAVLLLGRSYGVLDGCYAVARYCSCKGVLGGCYAVAGYVLGYPDYFINCPSLRFSEWLLGCSWWLPVFCVFCHFNTLNKLQTLSMSN